MEEFFIDLSVIKSVPSLSLNHLLTIGATLLETLRRPNSEPLSIAYVVVCGITGDDAANLPKASVARSYD